MARDAGFPRASTFATVSIHHLAASHPGNCTMNLLTTFAGSMMEGFLPKGWDLAKIDACCSQPPESIGERQPWWHARFEPVPCSTVDDFDVMLGHEIATAIRRTRDEGREAALILP